jgi:dephospho-CoA kinase
MTTQTHVDDNDDIGDEDDDDDEDCTEEEDDCYYDYYDPEDYVMMRGDNNEKERPHSERHLRIHHPQQQQQKMASSSSSRSRRHKRSSSMQRVNTTGHDLNSLLVSSNDNKNAPKPSSSSMAKFQLVNRFSLKQSTEQMFRETTVPYKFIGTYGHLRRKLDYEYHAHYQKQRQWLHDAIIEDSLLHEHQHDDWSIPVETRLPDPNDGLWIILIVGMHGSGKHHVVRTLSDPNQPKYHWKLRSYGCIDTDDIRRYLPEYSAYIDQSPDRVDALTRKECGYIGETLLLATLQAGRNAIVFCNLKNAEWYQSSYIPFLRTEYPHHLRFAIIHVTAAKRTTLARSRSRAILTGRTILEQDIEREIERIPKAVELLKPCMDYTCTIRNDEHQDLEIVEGGDWLTFKMTFDQTKTQQHKEEQEEALSFPTIPPTPMVVRSVSEGEGVKQRSRSNQHHHHLNQRNNFLNHETKMDAFTKRRSYLIRRRFSAMQSTEDNYKADHMQFYGEFAHIRQTLDYSYHCNYTFERQRFQDAILRDFLNDAVLHDRNGEVCTTPTHPWIVFTGMSLADSFFWGPHHHHDPSFNFF